MNQLEDALRGLATQRAAYQEECISIDVVKARIAATGDGTLLDRLEEDLLCRKGAMAQAEAHAREQAIVAFKLTGNKRPSEGASIRMTKTVVTNASPEDVKAWAMENMPHVLRIHAPTFNAQVKTGGIPSRLASVTQEPRGALAKDLSSWLTEETETPENSEE